MNALKIIVITLSVLLTVSIGLAAYFYMQLQTKRETVPIPEQYLVEAEATPTQVDPNSFETQVFFLNMDHTQLVTETRWIQPQANQTDQIWQDLRITERVRQVMEILIDGPKSRTLLPTIPAGTQLESVFWNETDRRIFVSFSPALLANHTGHSLSEWATIYSIVNTVVAQSSAIESVQILVNGEQISPALTNWDWSIPFKKDETFLRYSLE